LFLQETHSDTADENLDKTAGNNVLYSHGTNYLAGVMMLGLQEK